MEMETNTDNKTNVDENNQGCTTISFETHVCIENMFCNSTLDSKNKKKKLYSFSTWC